MDIGFDSGSVCLRLQREGCRVVAVEVLSKRPQVARLLKGRTADAAASLLPSIFALCGRAQGEAARLAVAAARGVESPPRLVPEIVGEVMREHLWRLLLDLPVLFSSPPLRNQFLLALDLVETKKGEALLELLATSEITRQLERIEILEQPASSDSLLLSIQSARASLTEWNRLDADMCRRPTWHGQAAETGAYARRNGQEVPAGGAFSVRWQARLAELTHLAAGDQSDWTGGTASAVPVAQDVGRALVETARGLLMHEVVLEHDRVADYHIVAPTEWNFHPQGLLLNWLIGKCASDEEDLRRYVAHAVAALDPCVRWELILVSV